MNSKEEQVLDLSDELEREPSSDLIQRQADMTPSFEDEFFNRIDLFEKSFTPTTEKDPANAIALTTKLKKYFISGNESNGLDLSYPENANYHLHLAPNGAMKIIFSDHSHQPL